MTIFFHLNGSPLWPGMTRIRLKQISDNVSPEAKTLTSLSFIFGKNGSRTSWLGSTSEFRFYLVCFVASKVCFLLCYVGILAYLNPAQLELRMAESRSVCSFQKFDGHIRRGCCCFLLLPVFMSCPIRTSGEAWIDAEHNEF